MSKWKPYCNDRNNATMITKLFEPGGVWAALSPEAQNELKQQAHTLAEVLQRSRERQA